MICEICGKYLISVDHWVLFHFRHIYDLQQRHYPSKTIMIGSTHIIKPNTFLQEIQNGVNVLNPCTDYADITVEWILQLHSIFYKMKLNNVCVYLFV